MHGCRTAALPIARLLSTVATGDGRAVQATETPVGPALMVTEALEAKAAVRLMPDVSRATGAMVLLLEETHRHQTLDMLFCGCSGFVRTGAGLAARGHRT